MIASIIRALSMFVYSHPHVPQNIQGQGPYGKLKIALLADYFTSISLAAEASIRLLTPKNYRDVLLHWQPDLIFVESAFHGVHDEWRYKLNKQPKYLSFLPSKEITAIAELARDRNIPAVFWNKDDGAFFHAFLDVARNFPYVFTTDSTCLPQYARRLPSGSSAHLMPMAYQSAFHNFTNFSFQVKGACFVGSYYKKFFERRRRFLGMIFDASAKAGLPMHIFDRNSKRLSHFFEFRFPNRQDLIIHPGVPYTKTANIYKTYLVSINVNSIIASETMYSRRLLEILACGGICITNHNKCMETEFKDYCHIVASEEEAADLLARLSFGPSALDLERARSGSEYVASRHTWTHRLQQLEDTVNF